jgi:hypothetical protein
LSAKKDALQVDGHDLIPAVLAQLLGLANEGTDAGVVDEDVEAPELLGRGLDQRVHVRGDRDVGGDGERLPPPLAHAGGRRFEVTLLATREHHVRPGVGHGGGDGAADAPARPRDQGNLVRQSETPQRHAATLQLDICRRLAPF